MQTASLEFPLKDPDATRVEVSRHVAPWRDREGNLIMILHEIQDAHGYVPREISMVLARELGTSLARIYEVLTFYHYFKLVPPGKHNVAVCSGTACHLKGSANILAEMQKQLGIQEGETTENQEFHLETLRCIGCCGMSPAVMIDGKTYGRVRSADAADLIRKTRRSEPEGDAA